MNVLVIGSGAREHAIAWKLKQSPKVDRLFVAPGNGGTASIAKNLAVSVDDIPGLASATQEHQVDLTVVGPDTPLAEGIVDYFQERGFPIFGPTRAAARIEWSKAFAKELMLKYGIPTGKAKTFTSYQEAKAYVEKHPLPVAIKADGLALGKGVTVAMTREEALKALFDCMEAQVFGAAGQKVLVEEYLEGQEVSVFCFTDGETVSRPVAACDYKRAYDGDEGPNTGGMGSYSPPEFWNDALEQQIQSSIMEATVEAMSKEGTPYKGVLYGGLILSAEGPKVIEFNSRLGDPETQVILPRLKTDLLEAILSVVHGGLNYTDLVWSDEACVGVVLASGGYPGQYDVGFKIEGLEQISEGSTIFHAGTKLSQDAVAKEGNVQTSGGRVMTVVAQAKTMKEARIKAYQDLGVIKFKGRQYRRDIASRAESGFSHEVSPVSGH